jgi:hypothetical protein
LGIAIPIKGTKIKVNTNVFKKFQPLINKKSPFLDGDFLLD